jgi:hypothetical protein
MEQVRRDGQPSLLVDEGERSLGTQAGWDVLFDEQCEQMAVECADLLTDDDLDAELGPLARERTRTERPGDGVVVGDGHHVEPACGRAHERLRRLAPVTAPGVHVEIGAAQRRRARPRSMRPSELLAGTWTTRHRAQSAGRA